MKTLEEAGLITYAKEGLWVNYRLADGAGNPYVANLLGNLRYWLEDDAEVVALVSRLSTIRREDVFFGPNISLYDELRIHKRRHHPAVF